MTSLVDSHCHIDSGSDWHSDRQERGRKRREARARVAVRVARDRGVRRARVVRSAPPNRVVYDVSSKPPSTIGGGGGDHGQIEREPVSLERVRRFLIARDVAALLELPRTSFWRLRRRDTTFPRPVRLNGRDRWTRADIESWLESSRRASARPGIAA
jgi:predicted DNA-binding transcriptional regulator AlpA